MGFVWLTMQEGRAMAAKRILASLWQDLEIEWCHTSLLFADK